MSKSDRLPNNKPPRTRTDTETHTHAHSSVDCDSRGHMGTLDDLLFCSLSSHITQRIENTREISERFLISFDWIASDCMEWSILIIIVSSFSADGGGDSKTYSRLFISCERTTTSWAVFFFYLLLLSLVKWFSCFSSVRRRCPPPIDYRRAWSDVFINLREFLFLPLAHMPMDIVSSSGWPGNVNLLLNLLKLYSLSLSVLSVYVCVCLL